MKLRPFYRGPFQPNLVIAGMMFFAGYEAIKFGFPTQTGSTTLAGAMFGAGAAFIGSWVSERNRLSLERIQQKERRETAVRILAPELARTSARLAQILDRATVNASVESVKLFKANNQPPIQLNDIPATFRPLQPLLYPSSSSFRDLPIEDAALLVDFYDSLGDIGVLVDDLVDGRFPWDFNAYNCLMQAAQVSARFAMAAIERFCPDIRFSAVMPAGGTLIDRLQKSISHADDVLKIHLERALAREAKK